MHTNLPLKFLNTANRPRERLLFNSAEALSDIELLAIILRTGANNKS
ncbi:UPF0758 domain-containing protein, partial [Patescibacteria group bacterium]